MKGIFICLITISLFACNSPMAITANPDDHTTTTGTVGSAKMTNQLPPKADNMVLPVDTLKTVKDSLPQ